MARRGAGQEVEPRQVPAQHALPAMVDERVEDSLAREELARILLDPQPRPHLERERQEAALTRRVGAEVEVIPEVAVRQVLAALRFEDVAVVAVAVVEELE